MQVGEHIFDRPDVHSKVYGPSYNAKRISKLCLGNLNKMSGLPMQLVHVLFSPCTINQIGKFKQIKFHIVI